MAWRWPGDKPLSEPRMESLLMHICVTRPQWVKPQSPFFNARFWNGTSQQTWQEVWTEYFQNRRCYRAHMRVHSQTGRQMDISYIEAETKWPPLCTQHFEIHFSERKYLDFNWILTDKCPWSHMALSGHNELIGVVFYTWAVHISCHGC